MRSLLVLLVLAATALAGCNDSPAAPDDDPFKDRDFRVSDTTGVIRGVVLDAAIRPLEGVTITLRLPDGETSTSTDAAGLFAFDAVPAGTHFVRAEKVGYSAAQQSVEVAAGDADPPMTKVIMEADEASRPFVEAYAFDGFIECGALTPALGISICGFANDVTDFVIGQNFTTENSQVRYDMPRTPDWAQSEMVWDSTQTAGQDLALMYSWGTCGQFLCDHGVSGGSPLLLQADASVLSQVMGNQTNLYIRVFADDIDETNTGQCIPPNGIVSGCPAGLGVTLSQKFTVYTHIFYGYAPPPDWRFTEAEVPQPPA